MSPVRIAVVLAAGAGSRFHGPGHKLSSALEPASGEAAGGTVIGRALAAVLQSGIGPVVVVTGAAPDVVPGDLVDQVTICHNPTWAEGQMTSLLVGLRHAAELGCIEAVIGLADQPFVTPDAWRTVAAAAGPIAVATYDGRRGTPVKLDRSVWHLLPAGGDEGARALMRVRPDLVREVACTGSPADIDTEEDLRRWQSN